MGRGLITWFRYSALSGHGAGYQINGEDQAKGD